METRRAYGIISVLQCVAFVLTFANYPIISGNYLSLSQVINGFTVIDRLVVRQCGWFKNTGDS